MAGRRARLAQRLKRLRQPAVVTDDPQLERAAREAGPPHTQAERRPQQSGERRA